MSSDPSGSLQMNRSAEFYLDYKQMCTKLYLSLLVQGPDLSYMCYICYA